jgi:TolB-like protein
MYNPMNHFYFTVKSIAILISLMLIGEVFAAPIIAITDFDNNTSKQKYAPLAKGLSDMLITDLSGYSMLRVVERTHLNEVERELKKQHTKAFSQSSAQQLGKLLGATHIITGGFVLINDTLRIDARVVKVADGVVMTSFSSQGNEKSFWSIQQRLTQLIIKSVSTNFSVKAKGNTQGMSLENAVMYGHAINEIDKNNTEVAQEILKELSNTLPNSNIINTKLSLMDSLVNLKMKNVLSSIAINSSNIFAYEQQAKLGKIFGCYDFLRNLGLKWNSSIPFVIQDAQNMKQFSDSYISMENTYYKSQSDSSKRNSYSMVFGQMCEISSTKRKNDEYANYKNMTSQSGIQCCIDLEIDTTSQYSSKNKVRLLAIQKEALNLQIVGLDPRNSLVADQISAITTRLLVQEIKDDLKNNESLLSRLNSKIANVMVLSKDMMTLQAIRFLNDQIKLNLDSITIEAYRTSIKLSASKNASGMRVYSEDSLFTYSIHNNRRFALAKKSGVAIQWELDSLNCDIKFLRQDDNYTLPYLHFHLDENGVAEWK